MRATSCESRPALVPLYSMVKDRAKSCSRMRTSRFIKQSRKAGIGASFIKGKMRTTLDQCLDRRHGLEAVVQRGFRLNVTSRADHFTMNAVDREPRD